MVKNNSESRFENKYDQMFLIYLPVTQIAFYFLLITYLSVPVKELWVKSRNVMKYLVLDQNNKYYSKQRPYGSRLAWVYGTKPYLFIYNTHLQYIQYVKVFLHFTFQ